MSYQFIIGASGSGKSTACHEMLLKSVSENPDKNHFLIVPEQFTLWTQKSLASFHPGGCIMDIDILDFQRLAYRVFREIGTPVFNVLEESGKSLIIRDIMDTHKKDLSLLGIFAGREGYINEIKSLISEFSQYLVTPEDLFSYSNMNLQGALKDKIGDLAIIYKAFYDYIEGEYITAERLLELLLDVIEDCPSLRDSVIVFDGFTGFSPIQELLVEKLLGISSKLIFTITMDPKERDFMEFCEEDLFFMPKTYMNMVSKKAGTRVKQEPPLLITGGPGRFIEGGRFSYLTRNFKRKTNGSQKEFTPGDEIQIVPRDNPKDELFFAASRIREYTKQGEEYGKIAIITGDMDRYEAYIPEIFGEFDLPVFIDKNEKITGHRIMSFLLGAIDMVIHDFTPRSLLSFVKTYLTSLSVEEIDTLENYLLATALRGRGPISKGYNQMPRGVDKEQLSQINEIRGRLWESIEPFVSVISNKDSNIRQVLTALYNLMENHGVENSLYAREESDVYDLIIGLFEKIEIFLGDKVIDPQGLRDLLLAGAGELKRKKLPQGRDEIIFGDIKRTRLEGKETVFILGVNEGIIPGVSENFGLLHEGERRTLEEHGLTLSPLSHRRRFDEDYYIYLALTRPSKRLILCYQNTDTEGAVMEPSQVIYDLESLFGDLTLKRDDKISTPEMAEKRLRQLLGEYYFTGTEENSKELVRLLAYFHGEKSERVDEILSALLKKKKEDFLDASIYKAIEGERVSASVSRLETYAGCAYRFYLQYILGLKKKVLREISAADMGTLYHDSLYNYCILLKEKSIDFVGISDADRERYLGEAVETAYGEISSTGDFDLATYDYVKRRVTTTLNRTLWALEGQLREGSFRPEYYEVSLESIADKEDLHLKLNDGMDMHIKGKIDRMDLDSTEDGLFIKIIDYKSADKKIDYTQLYSGLQMQLLYYLDATTRAMLKKNPDKKIYPSAVFYYHIDDPVVDVNGILSDMDGDKLMGSLRPEGLINQDMEVLKRLDRSFDTQAEEELKSYTSKVIKAGVTKTGTFSKSGSNLIPGEDLNLLMDFCRDKARDLAENIGKGDFNRNPYRISKKTPCEYCDFRPVCSREREDENMYKDVEKIKDLSAFKESLDSDK